MTSGRKLHARLASGGLLGLLLVGCGAGADERGDADLTGASSRPSSGDDCGNRDAVLSSGELCVDTSARDGIWRATLGKTTRNSALCSFQWEGDGDADEGSLRALGGDLYALESPCADLTADAPPVTLLALDMPPDAAHGGVHGCDVCGKLRERNRGWAVFPAEKAPYKSIVVSQSDGKKRYFQVEGAPPAGVVSFTLPAPPIGLTWVPGTLETL